MNMHVPRSIRTIEEISNLASVSSQIISVGNSKPIISLVQDSLVGAYMFSLDTTKLYKPMIHNLLMPIKMFNGQLPEPSGYDGEVPYWTGKQIFSLIIPDITINTRNIQITRGNLIKGVLDKTMLGTSSNGLIQQIYNVFGTTKCADFINASEKLITRWLISNSFSIGLGDTYVKPSIKKEVDNIIDAGLLQVTALLHETQNGLYMKDLDDSLRGDKLEGDLIAMLGSITEKVSSYVKDNVSKNNGFYLTVVSGAKGSELNIQQIMGSVAQQDIWGNRVADGFTNRTLPHFHTNDLGAYAHGYVRSNYIEGLNPTEMFFHAISGRNGKIDGAIKTAESGYATRKFVKAAEDIKVHYDYTVRNAANSIVSFSYGDDNFDPTKIEKIDVDLFGYDDIKMKSLYQFNQLTEYDTFMTTQAINEMKADNDYLMLLDEEYKLMMHYRYIIRNELFKYVTVIGDVFFYMPINMYRFIESCIAKFKVQKFQLSNITPQYVINSFNNAINEISQYLPEKKDALHYHIMIFKTYLSPKRIIYEYRMTKDVFDYLINAMIKKVIEAFINPGDPVGVIAAQTLGEITSQDTLNTFHKAGAGALIITKGMPRVKEIIELSKKQKSRNMKIYLKPDYVKDINKIKASLTCTKLHDILIKSEIIYEGDDTYTDYSEDREFIRSYNYFRQLFHIDEINNTSPWTLRFTFDKENMMNRKITIQEVQEAIKEDGKYGDKIDCIFNDDNSSDIIIRVKFSVSDESDNSKIIDTIKIIERHLSDVILRGITNITQIDINEENIIKFNIDGSINITKELMMNTAGSNLLEILSNKVVDATRTITNDIIEFYDIYGIEATRNLILQELINIFPEKVANPRHIQLIADIMTYRGRLITITRFGMNKNPDIGPLGKASFEEVVKVLVKASVFSEYDDMKGCSASLLAGQICKIGSNFCDIVFDEEKLKYCQDIDDNTIIDINNGSTNDEQFDNVFNKLYNPIEANEDIELSNFNFGFNMEFNKQHDLHAKSFKTDIKIIDKKQSVHSSISISIDKSNKYIESLTLDRNINEHDNLNRNIEEEEDIIHDLDTLNRNIEE